MSSGTPDSPATGGLFEGESPALTAGCVVEPRTGVIPSEGDSGSGQDDSGQLRAEIADTLNGELAGICASWRPTFADRAADALVKAGFVRVSVDDDTVEQVAAALADHDGFVWTDDAVDDAVPNSDWYRSRARAAVQALRDGNSQPTPSSAKPWSSHACCPHCTARKGSCVRCGVRDAEGVDGEQLCGPCDSEVEAEALRDGSGT